MTAVGSRRPSVTGLIADLSAYAKFLFDSVTGAHREAPDVKPAHAQTPTAQHDSWLTP